MIKVSVIIPVYNVESYLEKCLDSVVYQTMEDLEIICVNDGSTDGSPDILKRYEEQDSRIKVITTKNQGVSMARNTGMKEACGKYIYFLDGDDYLERDALEVLYTHAEAWDLELLTFSAVPFSDETMDVEFLNQKTNYYRLKGDYETVSDGKTLMKALLQNGSYRHVVWVTLVQRAFLERYGICFLPGVVYEDVPYNYQIYLNASRAGTLKKEFYNRRYRSGSIMTSTMNPQKVADAFYIYQWMKAYVLEREDCCKDEILMMPVGRIKANCKEYYEMLSDSEKEEIKNCLTLQEFAQFSIEIKNDIWAKKLARKELEGKKTAIKEARESKRLLKEALKENKELVKQLKEQKRQNERVLQSTTYKLGHVILFIPKKIKDFILEGLGKR